MKECKIVNLQPWLDYFGMLHVYEEKGLLEVRASAHEAYITEPALCALSTSADVEKTTADDIAAIRRQLARHMPKVLRRILAYAGWKSQEGKGYLGWNFALHVVKSDEPHDLLYTLLAEHVSGFWRRLFRGRHVIKVIDYRSHE